MPSIERQGKLDPGYTRHPGSIWIDDHLDSLQNNQWVAANKTGLVAKDASIDGLMAKIQQKGLNPADVAVAFITTESF